MYSIRLKELDLKGFRGFEKAAHLSFDEQMTVLISQNGAGKSSVLDAIALFLEEITDEWTFRDLEATEKLVRPFDTNINQSGFDNRLTIAFQGKEEKANVILLGEGSKELSFRITDYDGDDPQAMESYVSFNSDVMLDLSEGAEGPYPILVYYGGEYVDISSSRPAEEAAFSMQPIRFLDGALDGRTIAFGDFYYFIERLQKYSLQNGERHRFLQVVSNAVAAVFNEPGKATYGNLKIDWGMQGDQMLLEKEGQDLVIDMLSSGEKTILAVVGDLARRLCLANPEAENPLTGNGIVLIDEVGTHLHPAWQRAIVPKLMEIFPNVQFVVTTHSPLVLYQLYSKHIRSIEDWQFYGVSETYGHEDADDMLEIMGVVGGISQKIQKIHRLLYEGEIQAAIELRQSIETEGAFAPLVKIDAFIERKKRQHEANS